MGVDNLRRFFALSALLALGATPIEASYARSVLLSTTTAGKLAEQCQRSDGTVMDPCVQYIVGVYDASALAERICIPASGSMKQVAAVVIKALRDNPQLWHEHAAYFVQKKLAEVFPCTAA